MLGLDPGSRRFGWGLISKSGTRLVHVDHGVIETDTRGTFAARLVAIEKRLVEVINEYKPDCAGMESLFFAKDAQAAAKLGHARGVALLVCAREGLSIGEYAPTHVKRAVAGGGRAEKAQMAQMVRALLNLSEVPQLDASDALAIAITHSQHLPLIEATRAAKATSPRCQ